MEATACPRRWALRRASYPDVWDQFGYPPRTSVAAVAGDVVHESLELILRGLAERRCESMSDPSVVDVIRSLGGYSGLVERVSETKLRALRENPRMAPREPSVRTALTRRMPEMRQQIQTVIARTRLVPEPASDDVVRDTPTDRDGASALRPGSHPEVTLSSAELRLRGRADLISVFDDGCEITDYKTGSRNEHHVEQIRTYALLWTRDTDRNPEGLPVKTLTLNYISGDLEVDPPTAEELEELAGKTGDQIAAVEQELAERPPVARPQADLCNLCGVRHLCEDYWSDPASTARNDEGFVDREGTVVSQNGPRSWILETPQRDRLLLRAPTESPVFAVGDDVRLVDVFLSQDDESDQFVVTITSTSEVFQLDS
jgi:RecB family exonuclease